MIQIEILTANNQATANELLREYQRTFPKRKILNISMVPNDYGWFMIITYEVNNVL